MRLLALAFLGLVLAGCAAPQRGPGDGTVPTPPPPTTPPGSPPAQPGPWPTLLLTQVASGLAQPLFLTHAGDGSGRLYAVEQGGRVMVLEGGQPLARPFLDLAGRVSTGGEQGLLSIAFDPGFRENRRVYVSYTDPAGDTILARYTAQPDGAALDPGSARTLLKVDQPYANHNGGLAAFGPDGMLYFGLGDGGSGGDPQGNGQDKDTLLGKLLRLDVRGEAYASAEGNPFVEGGGRPEVWAYGLRNPWRFSFDRATGDLWLADVGQNAVEEVDFQARASQGGENYGWNVWEGSRRYRAGETDQPATFPVAEYGREGGHCSVTGGYVYRGAASPALQGIYLYADYCSGVVWGLRPEGGQWASRQLLDTTFRVSSFGEDESGELYLVDHGGSIQRIGAR